ncbi:MAG TPA: hypothetical protein VFW28_19470 [Micropepsaceae bacterium]|nr:hypothetical protein [Micropepsaceae bacterium]
MNTAGIISLLPAAAFSVATITQLSARSAGQALLADLGLGDKRRRWLQLLLWITAALLILPQFRVAGVGIAALEMTIFGLSMLNHRQYQYALPALIVLATLPLALPGPG